MKYKLQKKNMKYMCTLQSTQYELYKLESTQYEV